MKVKKNNPVIVYLGRYNHGEKLSGPEKTAKRIFAEHSKNNRAFFIQYFFDGFKYTLSQKLFGVHEEKINENAWLYTAGALKVYGILKKLKPDIIHIITYERFAVIALLYKCFNNVKIIYNEHGVIAYENSELKKLSAWYKIKDKFCEKKYLKHSDKIIFVSEPAINIAEKYYNINESKCIILANGIDEVFYNKNKSSQNLLPKAVFIYSNILYKSGLEFLRLFLQKYNKKVDLHVISDMDLRFNYRYNTVKPMNGKELAEYYKDKDIFLALNMYDTFSIAAAEAMASGLYAIVTRETGVSRYIENSFNGSVIPYNNVESLINAVEEYSGKSVEERKNISQNAASIYETLNWSNVYETYNNIYSNLV